MARLHPGVYIEEVSSGVRPIEGVGTSTAAFIGKAELGALNKAVLVTSFQEFQNKYGGYLNDSFLAHAVFQFFNNGGKACYLVRVAASGARVAEITLKDRKAPTPTTPNNTLTIKAANEGEWGNKLDIVVTNGSTDKDNEFALQVFRDQSALTPPLPPLLLETHDDLSMNPDAGNYVQKVIAAKSTYIAATVVAANLATAPAGESRSGLLPLGNGAVALKLGAANGGTETPGVAVPAATAGVSLSGATPSTNPPADQRKLRINLNGDGAQEIIIPAQANTGDLIAAAIQTAVQALTANNPANQAAYTATPGNPGFTCTFTGAAGAERYVLTSGTTGATSNVVVTDSATTAISLPTGQNKFIIEVDGDGPHLVTLGAALDNGRAIATAIQTVVSAIIPKRNANTTAFRDFTCAFQTDAAQPTNLTLLLTSGTAAGANRVRSTVRVTNAPVATENCAGLLKLGATNEGREVAGAAALRPANSLTPTEYHLGDATVTGNVGDARLGLDGSTPDALIPVDQDHINGLTALDVARDFSLLAIPGNYAVPVIDAGVNYCTQRGDCFFIADCGKDDDTVAEGEAFFKSLNKKTSYGALYFPWLKMTDPINRGAEPLRVPPSGFVAGMYARIDARRGVWKAPAGTETNLGGALGLTASITDAQQDFLNPIGVNVIRSFPASGIVIWGARTLATRSDPEYRYVPVRRTAIFLEQSLYNGIQWAVFEPNDEVLWASLRLNITAFMLLQFRAGAFQGKTPTDAFFVKCDSSTTTQADIDAGIVNILVGFAPLKPAEFVVLRLSQKAGQTGA